MKSGRTLPVIHLTFFSHQELQPVILPGILFLQPANEPLDAVVAVSETEPFHQILIDGYSIAPKSYLLFDPIPMFLTGRSGVLGCLGFRTRWPGWGILIRPGGHPR